MKSDYINNRLKGFLPKHPDKRYNPVGCCIYCGATTNLNDEHIIPFGLGGRAQLPKSSCDECSEKTSLFERTCLRTMYGPLRLLYDLPSRRRKNRPEKLPLKVKVNLDSEWSYVAVEQELYPFLVLFPYFPMPNLLSNNNTTEIRGAVSNRLWIRGASPSYVFKDLLELLTRRLNVAMVQPEAKACMPEFCQMLSKIAYSYAVAEIGYNRFKPFLIQHIKNKKLENCGDYIGSISKDEAPSNNLHELSIYSEAMPHYITIRIRLLAKLGTPTYYVVVGEYID